MKLIVAIIDDHDVDKVMSALTAQHIGVTRVSSTSGFLSPGNCTLLIGVEETHIPRVMKVITELAAPRQTIVPYTYNTSMPTANLVEVPVGGYMTFVLNIDQFEQV